MGIFCTGKTDTEVEWKYSWWRLYGFTFVAVFLLPAEIICKIFLYICYRYEGIYVIKEYTRLKLDHDRKRAAYDSLSRAIR